MESLKIAITGASGFIGANLARYFSQKHEVFALSRNVTNWRLNNTDINKIHLNLKNRSTVKEVIRSIRPDTIVHCAVYGGYHFESDTNEIINTNILGTINLLDACNNVPIFINTGSSSEYGIKYSPMKETDVIAPTTDYGMSKALITNLLRSLKFNAVTLRLFSAYGYYEEKHRLIPYVIFNAIRNKTAVLSDKNNVRDFIFIEDINEAYNRAIKNFNKIENGEIFNVGSGKESRIADVVNILGVNVKWSKEVRAKEPEGRGIEKFKEWMINNIEFYEDEKNDKLAEFKNNIK